MDRFTTSDIPAPRTIPPLGEREFSFAWTIEHFEGGKFVFEIDVEFDCEYGETIRIVDGRIKHGAEFSEIRNAHLERFVCMKMIEIEADPNFQRCAAEAWENRQ